VPTWHFRSYENARMAVLDQPGSKLQSGSSVGRCKYMQASRPYVAENEGSGMQQAAPCLSPMETSLASYSLAS
jgi:hypothetical protein